MKKTKRWQSKQEFKARVHEWATKLDANVATIYIRPMRRKWASCSTAGTLNFNSDLLDLDRELSAARILLSPFLGRGRAARSTLPLAR